MYLHRFASMLVCVLGLGTLSSGAQAAMRYDERIETFQIGGVAGDPASIWEGIRRFGPAANGASKAGATTAEMSWIPAIEKGIRGCRLQRVDVRVAVTMTLPAWSGRNRSMPAHKKYWDCVSGAVRAHEKGQAQTWKEAGRRIEREFAAITDWLPCGQLNELLKETAQRIEQDGRRRLADADENGRHTRYDACKIENKKPATEADAKETAEDEAAASASATIESATSTGQNGKPRLDGHKNMATSNMLAVANSSLWVMLWIGGALVAGMAGFIILMKHRLSQKDAAQVALFKERSLLLRFARKVDRTTGGHISRTSLPDRMGVRRKEPPAHLRSVRRRPNPAFSHPRS